MLAWRLRATLHYVHVHSNSRIAMGMHDPITSGRGIRYRDRQVRTPLLSLLLQLSCHHRATTR
jgi:hypothetical protein